MLLLQSALQNQNNNNKCYIIKQWFTHSTLSMTLTWHTQFSAWSSRLTSWWSQLAFFKRSHAKCAVLENHSRVLTLVISKTIILILYRVIIFFLVMLSFCVLQIFQPRLIGKACLWWPFCKIILCCFLHVLQHFQSEMSSGWTKKSTFSFIRNRWTWIGRCFIKLVWPA